jgi:beta-lactamase regulating signal transducer with metallopeptidase domain
MLYLEILIDYIIPVIYSSFVSLVVVLFVLFIFRIKDSNIRILFFFLPLVKPFITISERISKSHYLVEHPIGLIRLPDPNNIFNIIEEFERGPSVFSDLDYLVLLITAVSILAVLVTRWILLYFFYRKLAYEDRVGRKELPEIYRIIDDYTRKTKVKTPCVSLTHRHYLSPFIVGIKEFALVLSPRLLDILDNEEKEVLVQHELSHIKRNDNITGWAAMILRDLLFFNPFAYIAYSLIKSEQDKDSDKLVVKYTGRPVKEIARNILSIILKMKSIPAFKPATQTDQTSGFTQRNFFSQIRLRNRIKSILNTDPDKIYSRIFPRIMMCILFAVFLVIQIMFVVKINDFYLFLR